MSRDKQTEIHELAKQMSEAISTAVEQKYIMEEAKLEAVLRANGWVKAEKIFAEMREELVRYLMLNENIAIKCKEENGELNAEYWKGKLSAFKQIQGFIDAELKKKYTQNSNEKKG